MKLLKKFFKLVPIVCLPIVFAYAKKPLLERLLNVNDPGYYEAIDEMNELPTEEKRRLSTDLDKAYAQRKSADERANAISAIGDLVKDAPQGVATLKKALADDNKLVRQAAVTGLDRSGDHSADMLKVFVGLLNDNDEVMQAKALVSIGNFGKDGKAAASDVKKLLNHSDPNIRAIAKSSLEKIQ